MLSKILPGYTIEKDAEFKFEKAIFLNQKVYMVKIKDNTYVKAFKGVNLDQFNNEDL